jgi:penicillin-insensitive murein endopeptidase
LLIPLTLATGVVCAAPARADDSAEDPPREFPYLADETPSGSISVGDTANGFLVEPARIDDSDRLAILPKQRERNLRYGTDQLVAALEEASVALFSATRTRLWIGNVARRGGGDIAWSVSHNSGRDADIAFCYLDAKGRPADPPELVALNNEGVSVKHGLRFDAARTWIVVRSLLESRHAQVQYLFIAAPLKNQLLMHAKRTGVPAALIQRAAEVLWQPGNGAGAHDDHLHLRVYCNERDAKGGCVDSGIIHPWYKGHELAKKKRIGEVAAFLRDDRPEQRRRAIERLVLMDARDHAADLARGIEDADAGVRQAAVRAMAAFGDETSAVRLRALHAREEDLQVRIAIVHAAARLGGKAAGEILTSAVGLP